MISLIIYEIYCFIFFTYTLNMLQKLIYFYEGAAALECLMTQKNLTFSDLLFFCE